MAGSVIVNRSRPLLAVLASAGPRRRRAILETLSAQETRALCECVLNCIAKDGACPLGPGATTRAARYKRLLRQLAFGRRGSWRAKKQAILNQKGSGWILPIIASVLSAFA